MGGEWYSSEEEYRYIECYVVVAMCVAANILEIVMHHLKRLAQSGEKSLGLDGQPQYFEMLFTRGSSELMVLGFLAFVVWVINRSGGFYAIAALLPDPYAACTGPVSDGAYRRLAAASPSSSAYSPYESSEECKAAKAARLYDRKLFRYPSGPDVLHIVEDVHMEIFVAMCAYFTIMAVTVGAVRQKCVRWAWWEEHMREYTHFPAEQNRAGLIRLLSPLSDVKDFFKAKSYFVVWAQSGALRRLEERRARREAARRALHSGIRRLKLPALFAPADSSASLRSRPAAAVAAGARGAGGGVTPPAPGKAEPPSPSADSADERDSAAERRRSARDDSLSGILNGPAPMPNGPIRAYSIYVEAETAMAAAKDGAQGTAEAAAGLDGSALTPHTLGRQPRGADHRINEDFNFGAYLSLCYVQLLADMIEFRPATWSFVIALTVAEGGLLYTGIDEMMIDLTIACCTAGLIGVMWVLSKLASGAMLHAAEEGRIQKSPKLLGWLAQRGSIELFFLRLLQALTWRNLFRLVVFLLGEELRSIVRAANANGTNALSPARVASLVVLAGSSMMLPTIAFDWGLAMFLPPHIDERDVELAELVCWRQKHPLHSFSAPWEQPMPTSGHV